MKKFNLLIFSLLLLSCGKLIPTAKEEPNKTFEKDGVSISYPANWRVTEDDTIEGGEMVTLEKTGLDESAIISLYWYNEEYDCEALLDAFDEGMMEERLFQNSNLKFEPRTTGSYKNIETYLDSYTCKFLGLKLRGENHAFYYANKTFLITTQEALEDIEKNKKGFELIEQSFSCK